MKTLDNKEDRSNTSALPLTTWTLDKPVRPITCSKNTQRLFIDSNSVTFQSSHPKYQVIRHNKKQQIILQQ